MERTNFQNEMKSWNLTKTKVGIFKAELGFVFCQWFTGGSAIAWFWLQLLT